MYYLVIKTLCQQFQLCSQILSAENSSCEILTSEPASMYIHFLTALGFQLRHNVEIPNRFNEHEIYQLYEGAMNGLKLFLGFQIKFQLNAISPIPLHHLVFN